LPIAIVLLGGGIDSSTCAVLSVKEYKFNTIALTCDYGQKNWLEIEAAKKVCQFLGIKEHYIVKVELNKFGGSALTDVNIPVPEDNVKKRLYEIPTTYVPLRNMVFLSLAFSLAEIKGSQTIIYGVTSVDPSGSPDCSIEFINTIANAATYGSKLHRLDPDKKFNILTPLAFLPKSEIIKIGLSYKFDYSITYSCYNNIPEHCRKCDACQFRFEAFKEAGLDY
jgi:7-cyano-7-deazaguanine synthase